MKISCESNDSPVELTDIPEYPSMGVLPEGQCVGCKVGYDMGAGPRAVVFDGTARMFTCILALDKDLFVQLAAAKAMNASQEVIGGLQARIQENKARDRKFWGEKPQEESIAETMRRHENPHH